MERRFVTAFTKARHQSSPHIPNLFLQVYIKFVSLIITTLMMEAETVSEMQKFSSTLTRPVARDDFSASLRSILPTTSVRRLLI
jgi:hypothetical protein